MKTRYKVGITLVVTMIFVAGLSWALQPSPGVQGDDVCSPEPPACHDTAQKVSHTGLCYDYNDSVCRGKKSSQNYTTGGLI